MISPTAAGTDCISLEVGEPNFPTPAHIVEAAVEALSRELFRRLLAERAVAVAKGSVFGPSGEGWIRLSLATDKALLLEGAERLARFLRDEGK
jgi:aspartate/methionine/tyrosine aminotransferase